MIRNRIGLQFMEELKCTVAGWSGRPPVESRRWRWIDGFSKSLGTDCLTLLDLVPEAPGVGGGGEPILQPM